jgi:hypothetical protein
MDEQQALGIVTALANGTNPLTGEVFSPDSPYQAPEIIRALFTATRVLEAKLQRMMGQQKSMQPRNPAIGNAGKPWSSDEDRQLLAVFDAGKSLNELAQIHGRTLGGVRARLEKHGRLEPSPASRWPVSGTNQSAQRDGGRRQPFADEDTRPTR